MKNTPSEESSVDKIQASLDDLVARRRAAKANASTPTVKSSSEIVRPRNPRISYLLFGLLAFGLHAAGFYWFMQDNDEVVNTVDETVLVVEPPLESGSIAAPISSTADLSPTIVLSPTQPLIESPTQHGVIKQGNRVIVVPRSTPVDRPAAPRPTVTVAVAPARGVNAPAREVAPPAKISPGVDDHSRVALEFARRHFRYKYKVGSGNYAVTSLDVVISDTEEVPSWSRYRSTGEAGLEYYDGSGFRRTTRRFEVLTEVKNGQASGLEITVK